MKSWIGRQFRKKVRVYIMPTKMGGYLNGLIFLMFLLSVGYANNLLLIFTLFLFGFNLIWLVQTHFHMHALKFEQLQIDNGHAGFGIAASIFWLKSPQKPFKWNLQLESAHESYQLKPISETSEVITAEVNLSERGQKVWKFLRVASSLPFGLYHTWIYFPLNNSHSYVYPKILANYKMPDFNQTHLDGQIPKERKGSEDIRDLAPYQGEESRRISWKHYAKSGELLIKEGTEWNNFHLNIKLKLPVDQKNKESYLSELATQMIYCHRNQIPFTFEWEGKKLGPSLELSHLHECLKELSIC